MGPKSAITVPADGLAPNGARPSADTALTEQFSSVATMDQIDGLVQERRNSSVLGMELHLSCTNPPIWYL